jgi:hypothetical protein
VAHRAAVVVRCKARVAAITVTVQTVMIGRQVVVVAQQANPPMAIAVKRAQLVLAVLKATVAQTVIVDRTVMPAQTVIVDQTVMPAQTVIVDQTVMPAQIVIAALKGAMIKPAHPAGASRHLVTSQRAATNHHSAASPPLTNARILVISQRRKSHQPAAAMVARNAHYLHQKSALAHRDQAVMPHRRAAKVH